MVTKDMLDWTRDKRARLRTEMHLTPGGTLEAEVNETERISLEESIRLQEKILQRALQSMRAGRAERFAHGLATAHFNATQEITP